MGEFLESKKLWEQIKEMLWLLGTALPVIRCNVNVKLGTSKRGAYSALGWKQVRVISGSGRSRLWN